MARVYENWERLVRATLRTSGQGHERTPSGIAGAVPTSLGKGTNIDAILQAADAIQAEDANVSRILCEQAYRMAQNLDPTSDGRGVLQFKTGLMSVIKQKLARRDGGQIDRNRDIEHLWEFYQRYKQRHHLEDMQKAEQKMRESGTFTANFGDYTEMKKTIAILRALVEVMESLSKDADPYGVGRKITEELRRIKSTDKTLSGELTAYNIVPSEAPSLTNAIGVFPEVRGAILAIRYTEQFPRLPAKFEISGQRDADMFDLLEYVFGFQKDNVRNQRENIVLTIANAQSRLSIPAQVDPKIDEKAINEVFLKVLDNYIKWCKYLRIRLVWNSLQAINRDRKLFLVSLYFLIWGEAANVRFLPECICYIFHHMAKELDAILDHGDAVPAASCTIENDSVSFLKQIVEPIYETLAAEADRNNNGKAAHSKWRNYDDFNEYFWSPACFELSWPMRRDSAFLLKPKGRKRTGKSTFVEHLTFLHLYRSFHRLWIFLALMFQALAIIAFNDGKINSDTLKSVLSIGPVFAIMNFVESSLDVLLMFGAYTTARGMAISRLVIRFFWFGLSSAAVTYLYLKVLQERNDNSNNSFYFRIYILVLGVYAALRLVLALLLKFPACHKLSEMSDQSFFQFFKWIYEERYFVGRGLYERMSDYLRYTGKNNHDHGPSRTSIWDFLDPVECFEILYNNIHYVGNIFIMVRTKKFPTPGQSIPPLPPLKTYRRKSKKKVHQPPALPPVIEPGFWQTYHNCCEKFCQALYVKLNLSSEGGVPKITLCSNIVNSVIICSIIGFVLFVLTWIRPATPGSDNDGSDDDHNGGEGAGHFSNSMEAFQAFQAWAKKPFPEPSRGVRVVKKGGGGGKGTWGKLLDTDGESHIDRDDPNYDSGEVFSKGIIPTWHHVKAPAGGKAPTAGIALRHVRWTHSGKLVLVKKEGGGGKGTWGKLLYTDGETHIDRNDPNYYSGEEPYQLVEATVADPLDEYKKTIASIIEEYFTTDDVGQAASDVRELSSIQYHPYFMKCLVSMAVDRHDTEKEMASVLLSARAKKALPESSKGVLVIQTAEKSYLSAPHHAELVERRWGGSTHITVEEVKKKISGLLREYVDSGDTLVACRCIRELGVSFYHHDVVKNALFLGMETRTAEPLITKLLKEAAEEGIISSSQMSKGFSRFALSLDDLVRDIPSAKSFFQS